MCFIFFKMLVPTPKETVNSQMLVLKFCFLNSGIINDVFLSFIFLAFFKFSTMSI